MGEGIFVSFFVYIFGAQVIRTSLITPILLSHALLRFDCGSLSKKRGSKSKKKGFTLFFFSFLGYSRGREQLTPHSLQNLNACPVLPHALGLLPVTY